MSGLLKKYRRKSSSNCRDEFWEQLFKSILKRWKRKNSCQSCPTNSGILYSLTWQTFTTTLVFSHECASTYCLPREDVLLGSKELAN